MRSVGKAQRTVEEHRAAVAALLGPTPVEDRPLAAALGLVLAEDLRATIALPPFDNSAMDGYAVRAHDVADATPDRPVQLPVPEDIPAGRTDSPPLLPGTAHRIMTGAPMPPGADAVVQVEHTDGGVHSVRVDRSVAVGTHVRRAGEDTDAGALVLPAGTPLTAPRLGLAAAVGAATVAVRRPPNVLVLSTGSELVSAGQPLRHGQIYESNGVMLAAAVRDAGGHAEQLRFVPDDVPQFLAALTDRITSATAEGNPPDLILTSGGVSAGAYEVVKDALADRGVEFVRVAMQPGGPQGAGRLNGPGRPGVTVVTLPGNPVSSQVSFEVFVRPALRAAMGHPRPARPLVRAALSETLRSPAGKRQFRRGELDAAAGTVRTVGGPGSHLLSALARANCLIVLDETAEVHAQGTEVDVWVLDS
ncbi:MAG: molybdopterin molybdotransferase [Pseudonocardiales bacterium]|nr:molybdopterin molybdotransferase [Pseudonocardiales bacterium]